MAGNDTIYGGEGNDIIYGGYDPSGSFIPPQNSMEIIL
ncbi:hypothetical protein NON20_22835 [Synechocystis sp. B12]|nr:hypothetical protein NON20_22835 [Synechocystis sp. B12]